MSTPFPGMDPYLERPSLWPDVHNSLIVDIRNELAPQLLPRYYIAIEERTYLDDGNELTFVSRPDVTVLSAFSLEASHRRIMPNIPATAGIAAIAPLTVELPMAEEVSETYLEVRDTENDEVVTVLEILSPVNKRKGKGRREYQSKRIKVLSTFTHFIEIDLLRSGQPITAYNSESGAHYQILISRAESRPYADILPFTVRHPIPMFYLPLQSGDTEPILDLNHLLHELYERVGYQHRVNYREEPQPAFDEKDQLWVDTLLKEAGLRE